MWGAQCLLGVHHLKEVAGKCEMFRPREMGRLEMGPDSRI